MTKRTEITIETRRVMVIRLRRSRMTGWCEACLTEVQMMTPNEAASRANVSIRTIYRWIEEGKLHFTDEIGGSVLVCASSLGAAEQLVDR